MGAYVLQNLLPSGLHIAIINIPDYLRKYIFVLIAVDSRIPDVIIKPEVIDLKVV